GGKVAGASRPGGGGGRRSGGPGGDLAKTALKLEGGRSSSLLPFFVSAKPHCGAGTSRYNHRSVRRAGRPAATSGRPAFRNPQAVAGGHIPRHSLVVPVRLRRNMATRQPCPAVAGPNCHERPLSATTGQRPGLSALRPAAAPGAV